MVLGHLLTSLTPVVMNDRPQLLHTSNLGKLNHFATVATLRIVEMNAGFLRSVKVREF